MPSFSSLLALPAPLLLLLAAQMPVIHAQQGAPTAIRKMGIDPGEKFLHEYVAFADNSDEVAQAGTRVQPAIRASSVLTPDEEDLLAANASALLPFRAPFAAHFFSPADSLDGRDVQDAWELYRRAKFVEARLGKRDFSCPTGTSSCSSIGYPDTCCQSGTTCVTITDTGLGTVGCCPDGESCAGSISCSGDQEGCSSESGGGCCIAGYACASVGCTKTGVVTTTITLTSSSSLVTTTQTITSTSSTSSTTSTSATAKSITATSTTISASETTVDASAPVRPTSGSSSSSSAGYCPTGFYACSAVYGGGCCQTGRDCQTTSCPSTSSTTIISANGVTVVVPASDVPATTTAATTAGTCASGWAMCPSSAGVTAGCCPSGYSCGTASCTISSASATATVAKELPGNLAGKRMEVAWIAAAIPALLGFAFGIALI